eukprot:2130776-Pyramimonas_sp.AAC.1
MEPRPRRPRTEGVDLPPKDARAILNDRVPLAQCRPKELGKLPQKSKDGTCSEWATIRNNESLLSDTLDASRGRIPKQKSVALSLDGWLKNNAMNGSYTE